MINSENLNSVFNTNKDSGFELDKVIVLLYRYWLIILILPILTLISGIIYVTYLIPIYKATGTILITNDEKQRSGGTGAVDASALFSANVSKTADEVEILKSRNVMMEVLKELRLNPTCYQKGKVKVVEYYLNCPLKIDSLHVQDVEAGFRVEIKVINKDSYNIILNKNNTLQARFGENIKIDSNEIRLSTTEDLSNKEFIIEFNNWEALSSSYVNRLKINPIASEAGISNGLLLSFEDPIPKRAVQVIKTLVEVYNRLGIAYKSKADKNAIQFIDGRITLLSSELASVEKDIEQYKKQKGLSADVGSTFGYLLGKVGTSENKVTELEVRKSVLNALRETLLNNTQESYKLMPIQLIENSGGLANNIGEYNKLILDRDRLLKFAQPNNPSVLQLEEQLKKLRENISENINNNLKQLEQEIGISLAKFKAENKDAAQKLKESPQQERELIEIGRQKSIKEAVYSFLLQKREETALSLATTVPNARVLDAPLSSGPIRPNKQQIIISFFLIGVILAAIIIYIKFLLNDKIESEDDIRLLTNLPFLGYITQGNIGSNIVVKKGSRSSIAETFRLVRANLQFMLANAPHKVVLFTSSISGEGKTFVALNLGLSLAFLGKKTIVLGFDLRKPKLHKYISEENSHSTSSNSFIKGISNYLIGEISIEEIIQQSKQHENFYYIGSGSVPPNPAELISQPKTQELFDYLCANFDYILIDTAPIGLVVDGVILAKYATTTIYVTRFGITPKKQLRLIDILAKENKLPNPSIVLNATKSGKGYGYGYGYGYYSDENKSKKSFWKNLFRRKKRK